MDYDTGGAKGTGAGSAFVHCAAGVPLEDCSNHWVVGDNGAWVMQPSVKVTRHEI